MASTMLATSGSSGRPSRTPLAYSRASCHCAAVAVGRDGYRALAARLRDYLRLALVVLGVEDVVVVRDGAVALYEYVAGLVAVADACLRQPTRNQLGVLDR